MTREEALKLALSSTTSIPEAIKQAEDIMAYLSGENSIGSTWALDTAMVAGFLQTKQHPLPQKNRNWIWKFPPYWARLPEACVGARKATMC